VNQHWGACSPLGHLSPVQANPPGEGLVTCRRTAGLMERGRGTPLRTIGHLLYQIYPLMLQLGRLLPQLTQGH